MSKRNPEQKKRPSRRDRHRIIMAVLAGLMALLMILPMISMIIQTAGATSLSGLQNAIDQGKSEIAGLNAQIKELEEQIAALRSDKSQAQEQKDLLDRQIAVQTEKITAVEQTIAHYDALISRKETEVADTEEKEAIQYELFCRRVRAMEEEGTVTYWDILFSAADFADLLDRATFVSDVMEADNAIMDQLAATRELLLQQKEELETAREEQEGIKAGLEEEKGTLDDQLAQSIQLVRSIQSDEDAVAAQKKAMEEEADRIGDEIVKKQKELEERQRAGQVSFDPSSGWLWPIAGHYKITSLFANRIDPITGVYGHHTGTDIAAPGGTPIKAAANGEVIISVRGRSYGEYVVIQHHDGIQTLYAHMSSRVAQVGDIVNQGDVIGYVGSTGDSTGNHLHLEFRINGVRTDALNYYPSITFDYTYCG